MMPAFAHVRGVLPSTLPTLPIFGERAFTCRVPDELALVLCAYRTRRIFDRGGAPDLRLVATAAWALESVASWRADIATARMLARGPRRVRA